MKPPEIKECPSCRALVKAGSTTCPACGYAFPKREPNHGDTAFEGNVISGAPTVIQVVDFWVSRHKKAGKPDSVKLSFFDKMEKEYCMWLALDHGGYATDKALPIVRQFGGKATTVEHALQEWTHWKKPVLISVRQEGRFTRILGIKFALPEEQRSL
jgi:DNA repair protein RadD